MNNLHVLSQINSPSIAAIFALGYWVSFIFLLVAILLVVVPVCLVFVKAGRKWWEAIIPIYNLYILTIIIGQPWWIIFGFFIPVANWVVGIYSNYHLSKRFGYGIPFTLGLVFLPFIFFPILGYGKAVYIAPQTDSTQ